MELCEKRFSSPSKYSAEPSAARYLVAFRQVQMFTSRELRLPSHGRLEARMVDARIPIVFTNQLITSQFKSARHIPGEKFCSRALNPGKYLSKYGVRR